MTRVALTVALAAHAGLSVFPVGAADPTPQALIKAGHWKRARALIEQRCQADKNSAECAYMLSQVKEAFGDLDSALPLAEKAVALEGSNANYHSLLAQVCGETAQGASFFGKAGWAKRFKGEAEKAAELDAKNVDARFALMEYDLRAPRLMGGSKEKAAAMADEIAKIDPIRGYLAQARLAQEAKDAAREEAFFLKALAAKPGDYEILVSLANFYSSASQKKLGLAEKYAREALKVDTGQSEAYSLLARIYALDSRWTALDAILAQAEKNVVDDFNPSYQAGRTLLVENKDLPRAERYFRKYLTQEPEGNAPTLAHAHWRLGLVLEKEGHKREAISEMETALRLKPDLTEAKKDLKRLR